MLAPPLSLRNVSGWLLQYRGRWLIPTILVCGATVAYAFLSRPQWEAAQALAVREEGGGSLDRPGRFASTDAMKTAQETVLELARSRSVLAAALSDVGPPRRHVTPWPTDRDVEELQESIRVTAPNGAEFGRTELFYVSVRDTDRERAVALCSALVNHVDTRLREVRGQRAESLIQELTNTVTLARDDLGAATTRLAELEQSVGGDLAELRILSESMAGESNLRQTLIAVENDLRLARTQQRTSGQLLEVLEHARQDPTSLVATPAGLLESQAAIRQLKDGLLEAQLRTARLLGEMSEHHPQVRAALASEEEIRRQLYNELETAIRGLRIEHQLQTSRANDLTRQQSELTERMQRLSRVRADYGNLVAEGRHRTEILRQAEQDLAEARANRAAARSSSQITRLDQPEPGHRPLGPGRRTIILAGLLGGLAVGGGLVFLTAPFPGERVDSMAQCPP